MRSALVLLLASALLSACGSTSTSTPKGLTTLPGGDCVININPLGTGYGSTAVMSYVFGGDEQSMGGTKTHKMKIGIPQDPTGYSTNDMVWVGEMTGPNRVQLMKPRPYEIRITNLTEASASATIRDISAIGNPPVTLHVSKINASDVVAHGFEINLRPEKVNGVKHTVVSVIKDDLGGIKFYVSPQTKTP